MTPLALLLVGGISGVVFIYTLVVLICLTAARVNDERTDQPVSWFHRVMGWLAWLSFAVALVALPSAFIWWVVA